MNQPAAISELNRLYYLMLRSFPAYSADVRRVTYRGSEGMFKLLERIAAEQLALADRIDDAIRELDGEATPGHYPIDFTGWNDVALPRILQRSQQLLQQVVSEAESVAERNPQAPVFHFAKEVVNLTKGHVSFIEEALATTIPG